MELLGFEDKQELFPQSGYIKRLITSSFWFPDGRCIFLDFYSDHRAVLIDSRSYLIHEAAGAC